MAITREQAMTLDKFHYPRREKVPYDGALGFYGWTKCDVWRRNGRTQTWKARPNDFRVPIKFGLRTYANITQDDVLLFYAPVDCPVCHGTK